MASHPKAFKMPVLPVELSLISQGSLYIGLLYILDSYLLVGWIWVEVFS